MELAARLTKIVGALAVAGVLCWLYVPPAAEIVNRDEAVAGGPRSLIVVSTRGGSSDYALDAGLDGEIGGDLRLRINLRNADDEVTESQPVELRLTVFSPPGTPTTCEETELAQRTWADLGGGARSAFTIDRVSGITGAHPLGSIPADPADDTLFGQWTGTVRTVTAQTEQQQRDAASLVCVIPAELVWNHRKPRITGLLPQVNFNSIDGPTDFQAQIKAEASFAPDPKWVLSESYPAATAEPYSIRQSLGEYWYGKRGEPSNLGYTTQPTLLFVDRSAGDSDTRVLAIAGLTLGIAGSLVASAMARTVDVVVQLASAITRRLRRSSAAP